VTKLGHLGGNRNVQKRVNGAHHFGINAVMDLPVNRMFAQEKAIVPLLLLLHQRQSQSAEKRVNGAHHGGIVDHVVIVLNVPKMDGIINVLQ